MKSLCISLLAASTLLCAANAVARECKFEGETWVVGRTKYTCVRNKAYEQLKNVCWDGHGLDGKPCQSSSESLATGGIGQHQNQNLGLSGDQMKELQNSAAGRDILRQADVMALRQQDAMKAWSAAQDGSQKQRQNAAATILKVDTDLNKLKVRAQKTVEIQMQ